MKKLFALFIFCFMGIMQADKLSDAIVESDIEKVNALLSECKPVDRRIIKYLDIAEQTIRLRRDRSLFYLCDVGFRGFSKNHMSWMLGSACCLLCSASLSDSYETRLSSVKNIADFLGSASTISLIASIIFCLKVERTAKKYNDAVIIKGMLYDSSDFVTMDFSPNLR